MKFLVFLAILWFSAVSSSLVDAKGANQQQAKVNMLRNHKYHHSNLDFCYFLCCYDITDEDDNY